MTISRTNKDRMLVVGGNGSIGKVLVEHLRFSGTPVIETSHRCRKIPEYSLFLDLSDDISDWKPPSNISVAFLCAAATSQEHCRKNPELTRRINVDNICYLAKMLINEGVFTVFLSSNLVFDGSASFQRSNSIPNPRTEYGRQKAGAESLLLSMDRSISVVRLTKVIRPSMPLFRNWVHSLKNYIPIYPFSDLKFSPIPLDFVINVLAKVAKQKTEGIVQVSGNSELTYAQAAMHIAKTIGADLDLVQPVQTGDSGVYVEAIPAYSTLETDRLKKELGMLPPDIWQTIEKGCDYE